MSLNQSIENYESVRVYADAKDDLNDTDAGIVFEMGDRHDNNETYE